MKRKILIFLVIAVLVLITLAVLHKRPPRDKDHAAAALPRPGVIETAAPQRRDFTETRRWFGMVKSKNKTRIIALESGRIVSIGVEDGMPVAEDELLFTIGGPLIDSRRRVLRDKTTALRERVRLAGQMVKIKRDAVSQQFAKQEELAAAEDALARLKAEREAAGQELQRLQEATHLCATADGVFTSRKVSVGQEVRKGGTLAEIISQDHIYIAATLFPKGGEVELAGKRAVINLPGGSSIQGIITAVLPQRTATGASVVRIEGPDPAVAFRPGQTVTGTLILAVHEKMPAVPQDAIVRDEEERPYVFLKDSSGYHRRHVATGIVADGWVEIMSGLTDGEEVVVRGAYELFHRDFNKIYKVAD